MQRFNRMHAHTHRALYPRSCKHTDRRPSISRASARHRCNRLQAVKPASVGQHGTGFLRRFSPKYPWWCNPLTGNRNRIHNNTLGWSVGLSTESTQQPLPHQHNTSKASTKCLLTMDPPVTPMRGEYHGNTCLDTCFDHCPRTRPTQVLFYRSFPQ